jgi:hypothetical protein
MKFDDAIAIADAMSPQSQLRAMTTFRQTSSRFEDVRMAFINAVEQEVTDNTAASMPTSEQLPNKSWSVNWSGVIGAGAAAASGGFMLGWAYGLARLMGLRG